MEDLTRKGGLCLFLVNDKKATPSSGRAPALEPEPYIWVLFLALSFLWLMTLSKLLHFTKPQFSLQWGEWVLICWTVWRTGEEVEHKVLPKYESLKEGEVFRSLGNITFGARQGVTEGCLAA